MTNHFALPVKTAAPINACPASTSDFYCGTNPSACMSAFQLQAGYFDDNRNASTKSTASTSAVGGPPWGSGPPPWVTGAWGASTSARSATATSSGTAVGGPQGQAATTTVVATVAANSAEPPSKGPSSVAIGAGVGVPLGVALIGALVLLLRMAKGKNQWRGAGYGTEKRAEMSGIPRPPPQEVSAREVFEAPGPMDMRGEQVKTIEPV
ncbi:MAG: hypothetical protein M1836_005724 [Candelina mexicana]|nr:MAG: hypothetical protein M1836_005724 [Candelina mexicana]